MPEIRIKQGEALLLQFTFVHEDGVTPVDLTNVALSSQVRDATGDLVATLAVTKTLQTGVATVTQADTSLWPLGMLRSDVKAISAGLSVLSDTFSIRVERAVTQ